MGSYVRNWMFGLSALLAMSQVAFHMFDDDPVTPFQLSLALFVTLLPIVVGKLMGAIDDRNSRVLERMAADIVARHQKDTNS